MSNLPSPPPGKRSPYPREAEVVREPIRPKCVAAAVAMMLACPWVPFALLSVFTTGSGPAGFWLALGFCVLMPGILGAKGYKSPSKKIAIFLALNTISAFFTIFFLFLAFGAGS